MPRFHPDSGAACRCQGSAQSHSPAHLRRRKAPSPGAPMLHELGKRAIVWNNHGNSREHRLGRNEAERLQLTRKGEQQRLSHARRQRAAFERRLPSRWHRRDAIWLRGQSGVPPHVTVSTRRLGKTRRGRPRLRPPAGRCVNQAALKAEAPSIMKLALAKNGAASAGPFRAASPPPRAPTHPWGPWPPALPAGCSRPAAPECCASGRCGCPRASS